MPKHPESIQRSSIFKIRDKIAHEMKMERVRNRLRKVLDNRKKGIKKRVELEDESKDPVVLERLNIKRNSEDEWNKLLYKDSYDKYKHKVLVDRVVLIQTNGSI